MVTMVSGKPMAAMERGRAAAKAGAFERARPLPRSG